MPETRGDYEAKLDRQAEELRTERRLREGDADARRGGARVDEQPPRPDRRLRARPRPTRRSRPLRADPASRRDDARRRRPRAARLAHATTASAVAVLCDDGFGGGAEAAARTHATPRSTRAAPMRQSAEASTLLTVPFRPAGGPDGALVFADTGDGTARAFRRRAHGARRHGGRRTARPADARGAARGVPRDRRRADRRGRGEGPLPARPRRGGRDLRDRRRRPARARARAAARSSSTRRSSTTSARSRSARRSS